MKKLQMLLLFALLFFGSVSLVLAASSSKDANVWIGSGGGTLTTNAWLGSDTNSSPYIRDHDYQVSAVYVGSQSVSKIETKWKVCMDVRGSTTVSIGVSSDPSITAGASTSFTYTCSPEKYWYNTNGAKTSSWRATISASQTNSGYPDLFNTATLWVKNDNRYVSVSTGV